MTSNNFWSSVKVHYLILFVGDNFINFIDLCTKAAAESCVCHIRKAKTRRQIILFTHNPNLVVATDAEQVIIATAERPTSQSYPKMTYHLGHLNTLEMALILEYETRLLAT
jgi:hypothetical protein